ncbi:MAG: hypothetical protein ACE5F1_13000 [Planctomycetota bacterium]
MKLHALCVLLASSAIADAQTGPGLSRSPGPSWIIVNSYNSVPGQWIGSVQHVKLANNGSGKWTSALTVGALPAFFGGDGISSGIAIGEFDPYKGTFQISIEAASLNSKLNDRYLMLSPDGLWAIFERPDGVWLGSRKSSGTKFALPVKVTGLSTGVYPALGPVGGKMKVFYSSGQTIVMQDIDLANARVLGTPVIVYRVIQAGAKPISPSPLVGADGDVEGLFLSEMVKPRTTPGTGDADMVWANDLDPVTPGLVWQQRTDWTSHGGVAGGFIYWTHDLPRPIYWHVMHSEGAWLLGDDETPGGTANIRTGAVHFSAPSPLYSVLYMAGSDARPLPIPRVYGAFALDFLSMFLAGIIATTSPDGTADISFPIPPSPKLKGIKVALQAVVVDPKKPMKTLTNTAWLHIR